MWKSTFYVTHNKYSAFPPWSSPKEKNGSMRTQDWKWQEIETENKARDDWLKADQKRGKCTKGTNKGENWASGYSTVVLSHAYTQVHALTQCSLVISTFRRGSVQGNHPGSSHTSTSPQVDHSAILGTNNTSHDDYSTHSSPHIFSLLQKARRKTKREASDWKLSVSASLNVNKKQLPTVPTHQFIISSSMQELMECGRTCGGGRKLPCTHHWVHIRECVKAFWLSLWAGEISWAALIRLYIEQEHDFTCLKEMCFVYSALPAWKVQRSLRIINFLKGVHIFNWAEWLF